MGCLLNDGSRYSTLSSIRVTTIHDVIENGPPTLRYVLLLFSRLKMQSTVKLNQQKPVPSSLGDIDTAYSIVVKGIKLFFFAPE